MRQIKIDFRQKVPRKQTGDWGNEGEHRETFLECVLSDSFNQCEYINAEFETADGQKITLDELKPEGGILMVPLVQQVTVKGRLKMQLVGYTLNKDTQELEVVSKTDLITGNIARGVCGVPGELSPEPSFIESLWAKVKKLWEMRHSHSNKEILDSITEDLLDDKAGVPVVRKLPVDAEDGDMCLYSQMNTITQDDSGKKIYFDWKEFSQPLVDKWMDMGIGLYNDDESYLLINGSRSASECLINIVQVTENNTTEFYASFINGELDTQSSYMFTYNREVNEEIYFNQIDELPSCWQLPQFDHIETYSNEVDEAFFYSEYSLMVYRCDEWQKSELFINTSDIAANTSNRHNHPNKDVLDTIIPKMLEDRVPIVHNSLPQIAEDGDMCLYSLVNTLTEEYSGKRIYFNWEAGEGYNRIPNCDLWGLMKDSEDSAVFLIRLSEGIDDGSVTFINYTNGDGIAAKFKKGYGFEFGVIKIDGVETRVENIDELPKYYDLPKFETVQNNFYPGLNQFFHTEHRLMIYYGGKWNDLNLFGSKNNIPEVTTNDNGKVLGVVDGAWTVTDSGNNLPVAYINDDGELVLEVSGDIKDANINNDGELELILETENGEKAIVLGKVKGRTPEFRLANKILEVKYDDETTWSSLVDFSTIASTFDLRLNEETYFLEAQREVNGEWEPMVDLSALKLSHTHDNKTALDQITNDILNDCVDAISKKHTHENSEALNSITGEQIDDINNIPVIQEQLSELSSRPSSLQLEEGIIYTNIATKGLSANKGARPTADYAWIEGDASNYLIVVSGNVIATLNVVTTTTTKSSTTTASIDIPFENSESAINYCNQITSYYPYMRVQFDTMQEELHMYAKPNIPYYLKVTSATVSGEMVKVEFVFLEGKETFVITGANYSRRINGIYSYPLNGIASHAEGYETLAIGYSSHAEGHSSIAEGVSSHAEGRNTFAFMDSAHAEGYETKANGTASHAEGDNTEAAGASSHSEGCNTKANGTASHAEGDNTEANGNYSHAEGCGTFATGSYSHSEGRDTFATGGYSHTEGYGTLASSNYSHAEGDNTMAAGDASHAEGWGTRANGIASHSEGRETIADGDCVHVQGRCNIEDSEGKYIHIVGNGVNSLNRSNAHTVDWSGNAWYGGSVIAHSMIVNTPDLTEKITMVNKEIPQGTRTTPAGLVLMPYNYYSVIIDDVEHICLCQMTSTGLILGDVTKYGFEISGMDKIETTNLLLADDIGHTISISLLRMLPINLISYIEELKARIDALENEITALPIAEEVDF